MQLPTVMLSLNDRGPDVEALYNYLDTFGHLDLPERWKDRTTFTLGLKAALARFQQYHGLSATGELDNNTLSLIRTPRCGNSDISFGLTGDGDAWPTKNISYQFGALTIHLPALQARDALVAAMNRWADAAGLTFTQTSGSADIDFLFATGNHGDGNTFDGPGGVLAHAFYPPNGNCHFDDDEVWTDASPQPAGTVDLVTVGLHEIGHTLGLTHSSDPNSVMYAYYSGERRSLQEEDVYRIRNLYRVTIALDANGGRGGPYFSRVNGGHNHNLHWKLQDYQGYKLLIPRVRENLALDANGGRGEPYFNEVNGGHNHNLHWKLQNYQGYDILIPRVRDYS